MSRQVVADVEEVLKPDMAQGQYIVAGYRWILYAPNGLPIAQQVRSSSTEDAAWQAFHRFWNATVEIGDCGWHRL